MHRILDAAPPWISTLCSRVSDRWDLSAFSALNGHKADIERDAPMSGFDP
jgi:hypothetical protein